MEPISGVLSTGCQWRAIPKDLPPKSTVYEYFDLWTYDGTLERIHHALYEQCREQARRDSRLESDGNSGSHAPDSHASSQLGIPSGIQMSDVIH